MTKTLYTSITFVLLLGFTLAQSNEDLKKYGFINISTDSLNVPFFVDGFYVGNHPLKGPIPVLPGFHEVSYLSLIHI